MTRSLFLLAFLAGCPEPAQTSTITDEGTACLSDAGVIEVMFPGCLSSSCDTLTSATCTAELVDGVLQVHAEAVIESEGNVCTDDCGLIRATCDAPLIEDPETVVLSYAGLEAAAGEECTGL